MRRRRFFWKIAQVGEQTNDRGEQLLDNLLRSLKNEKKNCTSFHQSVIHFQIARVHNQVTFINGYDQRYLLYPSMSDFPASDPSSPSFNNWLDSLPPYGPILIKDKKNFKSTLCTNCKKIYLEQKFPFRALDYHIKDSDDFTLLLIKMP